MSMTAVAIVLGALILLLLKTRWLRPSGALACVIFGVVLGAGPLGPMVDRLLTAVGDWTWVTLTTI